MQAAAVADSPQTSEGRAWWFLGTLVVGHLIASGTGPVVLGDDAARRRRPALHVHHDLDDSSFLLDGQMVVRCGEQTLLARAGDWLSLPRGVRTPSGGRQPARPHPARARQRQLPGTHTRPGPPAGARQLPPPTGGPGLTELSRALAEHDVTVAGSSLTNEDAQAFMAEHG